jgi:hypothetical protein
VTVPTAFDASVHATSLVLGESAASSERRSSVTSSVRTSIHRTSAPASAAARIHGRMFAS